VTEAELQWGHGDEAVEETDTPTSRPLWESLQWGHGDEAVEESESQSALDAINPASMGPRR